MQTFSYEAEGALHGRQSEGVMEGQGLKIRGREEQYYPVLFCLSLASMYNCIFLGRKRRKDELPQWVYNAIFEMWLKDYIEGQPKESYPLINS